MTDLYQHLRVGRVEHENPRRRSGGRKPRDLADPEGYARALGEQLASHKQPAPTEIPGFDDRRLLRLTIEGITPEELETIPGVTVVAEEGKNATVLFATEGGLADFKSRLDQLAAGRPAKRKDVLFAIERFDDVTPEDRIGPALAHEGAPDDDARFLIDVELWPLERSDERQEMLAAFQKWCEANDVAILDRVDNAAVLILRVELNRATLDSMLLLRDVRQLDLPPRYELDVGVVQTEVGALPEVQRPLDGAPGIVVLDSGIATAHPLLGPAVGDAQSFTGDLADTGDHGTSVGALALHGDLDDVLEKSTLSPEVRLFGARVWGGQADAEERFIDNRIESAVQYFTSNYGCKVFNLSFGDERHPYRGGHVDRLAASLDVLARDYGVLFVVSAGNFNGSSEGPMNWREEYPGYLLRSDARIVDPAPALNVLTVGSIARYERPRQAARAPNDPAYQPIARKDHPSPFTRSGPGPGNAIKPELVYYGGNQHLDTRGGMSRPSAGKELGELSANHDFATRGPLGLFQGTSLAAPSVANLAGRLLVEYPDTSASLLRALLVAHAGIPEPFVSYAEANPENARRLVGYGTPRSSESRYSSQSCVTLVAEESIERDQHHFFEIPLPEDFLAPPAKRTRRISVGLAHTPRVRRSRLAYRESALSFRAVRRPSLEEVVDAFRRLKKEEQIPSIGETGFVPGPRARDGGTVQAARRTYKVVDKRQREKKLFVVVTNRVPGWVISEDPEPYALCVVIEDLSETEVRLYDQVRVELELRARARANTRVF